MYKGIKCLCTNMLVLNCVVLIERGGGARKKDYLVLFSCFLHCQISFE